MNWALLRELRRQASQVRRVANKTVWRRLRHVETSYISVLLRAAERSVLSGQGRRLKLGRGHWAIEDAADAQRPGVLELKVPAR